MRSNALGKRDGTGEVCEVTHIAIVWRDTTEAFMGVQKRIVSLVKQPELSPRNRSKREEYANMGAAASGALTKAKAEREHERAVPEAELERRLSLPLDRREPVGNAPDFTSNAQAHLATMTRKT